MIRAIILVILALGVPVACSLAIVQWAERTAEVREESEHDAP